MTESQAADLILWVAGLAVATALGVGLQLAYFIEKWAHGSFDVESPEPTREAPGDEEETSNRKACSDRT